MDPTFENALHPKVAAWFRKAFGKPTEAQELCIPDIAAKRSVLLSSPTGSGKTLAGFLGIIDRLAREHYEGTLSPKGIRCVYVSPLRALAYDIEKNLQQPLAGLGLEEVITVGLRTGDTKTSERQKQRRKPPHILITTPESLAIILPQKGYREALERCEFVIVDELHAFAENKRGVHLTVSLERLERLRKEQDPLCRIGLSATVAPLDRVADFLTGSGPKASIRETSCGRRALIEVMTPIRKHAYPPAGYTATRVITDMARIVDSKRSTLIFTNTRSGAERIAHRLKLALPKLNAFIECHHSSLDRDIRQEVEDRLKDGELRAVVCSTSLELGIDIGHIDTVIMVSTPKGISRALQRVGRSGHSIHTQSHGVLVATNINDLIECIVCSKLTHLRQLDPIETLDYAPDVAVQHIMGMAMDEGVSGDDAYDVVRSAYPFRGLARETFDRIVEYLEGGGRSLQKQYRETFGKIEEKDGLYHTVSKKVEREYLVNVGTIHADGMVGVLLNRRRLGSVEERFVKGLKPGDIFVLAGKTVKLIDSSPSEVTVENAAGRLPTVPSWNANKMPLASGMAREVARLRTEIDRRMNDEKKPHEEIADWLVEEFSISQINAAAILEHFENQSLISKVPTEGRFLIERFVDEQDDDERVHFFFHSLIGRSANDALSRVISHRVREAVGGNTLVTIDDYGFLLSVKQFQAMDVEEWKKLFVPDAAAQELRSALEGSQLVKWQFSGIAQTGLMIPRNLPGGERKMRQLRWSADILFKVLAEREPDHPLLEQAIHEATHTFLDSDRAVAFLESAQKMEWQLVEVPAVSPFAFGLYASKIKESMMMESPEEAIERLYREMQRKLGREVE
ncbi:MAG: DEAD/DEAH box helicase [Verrucomicrobiales bacterium]|nr:DEAD/DEAH box helicase [Verrucomicrobiales bacterium]